MYISQLEHMIPNIEDIEMTVTKLTLDNDPQTAFILIIH